MRRDPGRGVRRIDHDKPTAFLAYTIKGWGTPLAGHKDNHAGLMTTAQMAEFQADGFRRARMGAVRRAVGDPSGLQDFLRGVAVLRRGPEALFGRQGRCPRARDARRSQSTQARFRQDPRPDRQVRCRLAERIVTTSPDVTVSTNLGPWVNRRGLFARDELADTFRDERVPSAQKWRFSPEGQHIELGIAEMNLFLLLGAAGLSHSVFGERLLPIGTVYDPFVARGLDALNYACYQDARFIIAGTPSGVTLAPEGGAHQSIGSPLIGMSQDGLAAFEPAYLDELAVIMEWAFDYMQRDGNGDPDERTWLRDETGGSVYLRLSTRSLEQPDHAPRRRLPPGGHRWRLLAARARPKLRRGHRLSGLCRA